MKTNNLPYQFFKMKKTAILFLFTLLVISCGKSKENSVDDVIATNDLEQIREKKAELSRKQSELTQQIDRLDEAINKLDPNKGLSLVTTQRVQDTLFKHYAEVQGDVSTDENIIIYPETAGILRDVRVQEGQQVSKGQILAVVDDGGLSSELARLQTQAELAKTTFERQERLWEQNIGSEIQYLEAKSNFEALQNSIRQLQTQIAKSNIRAPFSGVIDDVITTQGEVVSPGQSPLFRLVSLKNMYVEAEIPENYLSRVNEGTDVRVAIGSINKEFEGKIRRIGKNINPNNRTFRVEVAVPNENGLVRPNQIATVKFNDYTNEDAIIIPENAVQQNAAGQMVVYVLEKSGDNTGIAKRRMVETGLVSNEHIEITQGIEPGETVIIQGSRSLRDGQEVIVRNQ